MAKVLLIVAFFASVVQAQIVIDERPMRGAPSQFRASAVQPQGNPIDARGVHRMWIVVPHLSDMQNLTTYAEAQALGADVAEFVAHESQGLLTLDVQVIEVTTPAIASTWNCIEQPEIHTTGSVWDYMPYLDAAMLELGHDKWDIETGPLLMQVLMPTSPTMDRCMGTGVAYPNNIHSFVQREANWAWHSLVYFSKHEFGHNLTLGHDSSDLNNDLVLERIYGGVGSPQGNPRYYTVGWSAVNHKQLGWKQGQNVQYPNLCIHTKQDYELEPVETQMVNSTRPQSVTVLDDRLDGGHYVFSFRSTAFPSRHFLDWEGSDPVYPENWWAERIRMREHVEGMSISRFSNEQEYLSDNRSLNSVLPGETWTDGRYTATVGEITLDGNLPIHIEDNTCEQSCHP
jgi:hypothetical protein